MTMTPPAPQTGGAPLNGLPMYDEMHGGEGRPVLRRHGAFAVHGTAGGAGGDPAGDRGGHAIPAAGGRVSMATPRFTGKGGAGGAGGDTGGSGTGGTTGDGSGGANPACCSQDESLCGCGNAY